MGKMDTRVMCVKDDISEDVTYTMLLEGTNCEYIRRGDAEEDPTYRQVIPYSCVVNPETNKILVYNRKGTEERLHGLVSFGVGGHIDEPEMVSEGIAREMMEECGIESFEAEYLGMIRLSGSMVDKVHLGMAHVVIASECNIGEELYQARYVTLDELCELEPEMEEWSKALLVYIKEWFNKRNSNDVNSNAV